MIDEADMVIIYSLDSNFLDSDEIYPQMSQNRRSRYDRQKTVQGRLELLGSAELIKRAYGKSECLLNIKCSDFGKPYVVSGRQFNVSHSDGRCILALADNSVGVDIQKHIENDCLQIAKRCFHPTEYELIKNSNNPEEVFYDIWCLKESYIKCTGKGLSCGLNTFYFNLGEHIICFNAAGEALERYSFKMLETAKGYSAAVCVEAENIKIQYNN